MKKTIMIAGSILVVILLLAGGAFMAGRLLRSGQAAASEDGQTIKIGMGEGPLTEVVFVPAPECPASEPDVAGVYDRRQDNGLFINETQDGFMLSQDDTGSISVTNATGSIREVVVTGQTAVYVDLTNDNLAEAVSDGKLYQKLKAGTIEEIGDLSYVRAWGETRGDRLIASVLIYMRPPVIRR